MADDDKQDFAYEEEQAFEESSSSEPQEEDAAEYEGAEDQEDDPGEAPGDDDDQEDLSEDPQEDEDEDQDDGDQDPDEEEQGEEADPQGDTDTQRPALTPEDLDNTSAVTRALNRAGHDPSRLYERSEDLPDAIKRKLEALDKESAKQKESEDGTKTAPDESDDGGSRFFGLAQTAIARSKGRMSRSAELFKKNFKIFLIIIAFAGYYVYLNYIGQPVIQSFSDLKEATPLKLDDYTTLNKVEEDGPWIVMEIIKDEAYYQGQSIAQREESLDRIEANAQSLCSNSILGSMIRNGRKITVLLKGSAGSFTRNFTVEQCPGTENDQSH